MYYLIALFAALLVLAPLMALLPSPQQRHRARLQRRGLDLGMEVRPGLLPQSRMSQRLGDAPSSGAAYRLPARLQPQRNGLWCRREDGCWENPLQLPADAEDQAWLESLEQRLPRGVVALEFGAQGITVFWREPGDEAAVERLHAVLYELVESWTVAARCREEELEGGDSEQKPDVASASRDESH